MPNLAKQVVSLIRVPLTRWYLRKEREFDYRGISVSVKPGVFHPGLFPSTSMLLEYLSRLHLEGLRVLELGSGSGLLSIVAEKAGAVTTASDVSVHAVENTRINADRNRSSVTVIHSDLFERIPAGVFDWVIINPPYYARTPHTDAEAAWYCGENFEYFRKLFPELKKYLAAESRVLMTLTQECNVDFIRSLGSDQGFDFELVAERKSLLEGIDYLFCLRLH